MQLNSGRYKGLALPDRSLPPLPCQNAPQNSISNAQPPCHGSWGECLCSGSWGYPHEVWLRPLNQEPVKRRQAPSHSWEARLHFLGEVGFSRRKDPSSCWTPARRNSVASPSCKLLLGFCCCCGSGCLLSVLLLQAAAPCPCSGWLDPAPAAPVSVQQLSCGEGSTAQGPHLQGICWEELLLMPAFTQMDTLCVGCGPLLGNEDK